MTAWCSGVWLASSRSWAHSTERTWARNSSSVDSAATVCIPFPPWCRRGGKLGGFPPPCIYRQRGERGVEKEEGGDGKSGLTTCGPGGGPHRRQRPPPSRG